MRGMLIGLAVCLFAGCSNAPTARSVDWYKSHEAERKDALRQCEGSDQSANCVNARRARDELHLSARGFVKPTTAH